MKIIQSHVSLDKTVLNRWNHSSQGHGKGLIADDELIYSLNERIQGNKSLQLLMNCIIICCYPLSCNKICMEQND